MRIRSTLHHGPVEGYQFGYSPVRFVKPFPVWCYYLHDTLIDTGQRHCQADVLATFRPKPIRQIILTHFHEDHSGNVAALARAHEAPVLTGTITAERIRASFPLLAYEQFWFGAIDPCSAEAGVVVQPLPEVISVGPYGLRPMLTPGHSDDHHVLLEPNEGWLFAGDFYVGKLKIFRRGENIYQMIESTRRVLQYDFDTVFCGHNPVLKHGKTAVRQKLQYLEDIVGRVQQAYDRGVRGQALVKVAGLREQWAVKLFTQNDVGADYVVRSVLEGNGQIDLPVGRTA